jgi:Zn-finger domain-containing protein
MLKIFTRNKTNGETAPAPALQSETLRRQIEPEMVILEALKNDLETAQSQQVALRQQADAAKDADALSVIRKEQDFNAQTVERLKQAIAAKRAAIAPLKQAYENARNSEHKAKQAEENDAACVQEETVACEAFNQIMKGRATFGEAMHKLQALSPQRWHALMKDLDLKVANMNWKGARSNGTHL